MITAPVAPGPAGGLPQLAAPVEAVGLAPQVLDLVRSERVFEFGLRGCEAAGGVGPVRARGDLDVVLGKHRQDRLDPETCCMLTHVVDHCPSLRSSSAAAKNADAVLRISLARFSRATSARSLMTSWLAGLEDTTLSAESLALALDPVPQRGRVDP
jgi:hypothetical protein